MKSIIAASAVLLASLASPAFGACGVANTYLTQTQVNSLLGGRTACGKVATGANAPGWNESHSAAPGGNVIEYHNNVGQEVVGTWNTATSGGRGRVTYAYTGGVAPVYEIAAPNSCGGAGAAACIAPGNFQFCGVGGGAPAVLNIQVTVAPANLASCTGNN